jgi:hypothetical protein
MTHEEPTTCKGSLLNLRRLTLFDRSNSDSNLLQSEEDRSTLSVDKSEYTLGSGDTIKVTWSIHEDIAASDWIGLFLAGMTMNSLSILDSKVNFTFEV